MRHTSDDGLGRRRFQLGQESAVEAALDKIRHAPAAEWHSFCHTDYALLKETLGELWIHLERERWDHYSFSALTCQDLRDLIALGSRAQGHAITGPLLEEMDAILSHSRRHPGTS